MVGSATQGVEIFDDVVVFLLRLQTDQLGAIFLAQFARVVPGL